MSEPTLCKRDVCLAKTLAVDGYCSDHCRDVDAFQNVVAEWRDVACRLAVVLAEISSHLTGSLALCDAEIRDAIGNTNVAVLRERLSRAEEALNAYGATVEDEEGPKNEAT
jgi:hypothetical protein